MAKKKIDYASLYTLRKDGRYVGSYTDDKGRHYVYDKDPERLHEKLEAAKTATPRTPTFKELAERWWVQYVEKELEESSQATYKAPFNKAVEESGHLPIDKVTAGEINRILLLEKSQGYSYKHAASVKSMYKQIMDFAITEGYILYNPTAAVTVPRKMPRGRRKAPTDDILESIESNLDKPFGDFVAVLLYTGLRTQEAAALQWGDIDTERGVIDISRAAMLRGATKIKDTKTEAGTRQIPILPPLLPYIKTPKTARPTDYVFNDNGKLLTRGQINSRWLNWCKAAGLAEQKTYDNRHRGERECVRTEWRPLFTPHQLRHNYATICVEEKLDEMVTKTIMGHSDINLTKSIYAEVRSRFQNEEVEKLKSRFSMSK